MTTTAPVTPAAIAALDHRAARQRSAQALRDALQARAARERLEAATARRKAASVRKVGGPHPAPACRWCGAPDALAVHGVRLCVDCADTVTAQAPTPYRRTAS